MVFAAFSGVTLSGLVWFVIGLLVTAPGATQGRDRSTATRDREKITVTIQSAKVCADVAKSPQDRQIGLSGRRSLAQDEGMLLVFDRMAFHAIWMRGMKFPIDVIFISGSRVATIIESAPPLGYGKNSPVYTPDAPVDKVLETHGGLAKRYMLRKGDSVTYSTGTSPGGSRGKPSPCASQMV